MRQVTGNKNCAHLGVPTRLCFFSIAMFAYIMNREFFTFMEMDRQINRYLRELYDEDQEIRMNAINHLGEIGDELCLMELREQLKNVSMEQQALTEAVGKLKQALGIDEFKHPHE